jgi:hypothetical protein
MTKKLEELFDLPGSGDTPTDPVETASEPALDSIPEYKNALQNLDKIELALPAVRGLESSDAEMDELATSAKASFDDLMDLGMQVDSRFASEIFSVASNMLGHAITAKNAKINKKLKIIELQLKKARLDQTDSSPNMPTAEGMVLDRNEMLAHLLKKPKSE